MLKLPQSNELPKERCNTKQVALFIPLSAYCIWSPLIIPCFSEFQENRKQLSTSINFIQTSIVLQQYAFWITATTYGGKSKQQRLKKLIGLKMQSWCSTRRETNNDINTQIRSWSSLYRFHTATYSRHVHTSCCKIHQVCSQRAVPSQYLTTAISMAVFSATYFRSVTFLVSAEYKSSHADMQSQAYIPFKHAKS